MKPTLGQVFALSLVGLAATLGLLFTFVLNESRATIMESSERIRDQASREISERVTSFLKKAPDTVAVFQRQIKLGFVDPADPKAVESALSELLLAKADVSEITVTYAEQTGFDADGEIQLAAVPRWQVSVVRSTTAQGDELLWSRYVHQEGSGFVADRRTFEPALAPPLVHRERSANVSDPTAHLTFTTPASRDFSGQLLWSDLHWSQLDADEAQREIEVSVQQTIANASDKFAGVFRVGLLTHQLDRAVQLSSRRRRSPILIASSWLIARAA